MLRIGVVGHRFFNNPGDGEFVAGQCTAVLEKALKCSENVIAFSAIAEGADSLFAEAAISLNIPVEIVRPFEGYLDDFVNDKSGQLYARLRALASKETKLVHSERTIEAYYDAMQWIVKNADILVAVWNGEFAGGKGGTADAIKYVLSSGNDWVHINVANHSVTYHVKKIIMPDC